MKTQTTSHKWAAGLAAGSALAGLLLAGQARALDVIDPTGVLYSNVSDSSHYNSSYTAANLFNADVTCIAPGQQVLTAGEFARSGPGTAWVSFQVDAVYTVGSIFYAQRAGSNTGDNMQKVSVWASQTTAFNAADPGSAPNTVVPLLANVGTPVWREYLLTNNVIGRYFLLKLEQTVVTGNPGGNEFRLGATLGRPAFICSVTPASTNTYDGSPVQFSVQATGTAPLAYQWQACASGTGAFTNVADSGGISGATTATLQLQSVPLANVDYQVIVTNAAGSATSAPPVTLTVSSSAPQIVADVTPATLQQAAGYAFSLSVGVAGSRPMTFQWQHNGVALADGSRISGSRSNILTIANAQAGDAGNYQLFMTNNWGNNASLVATVTVVPSLPVIDPTGGIYSNVRDSSDFNSSYVGANLFNLNLTGIAPGSILGGAEYAKSGPGTAWVSFQVDAVYTVGSIFYAQRAGSTTGDNMQKVSVWASQTTAFNPADPGSAPNTVVPLLANVGAPVWREYFLTNNVIGRYFLLKLEQTVLTGNPGGNEFRLGQVPQSPEIITPPTNQAAYSGNTVQFSVLAAGVAPLAFQWQACASGSGAFTNLADSGTISGSTGATLTLYTVPLADVDYRVVVTNSAGSATSAPPATLTVSTSAPQILADVSPASLQQPAGYRFSLSVGVAGSMPMNYQWKHNGVALTDNVRVSGSHSNSLTVANAQAGDAGSYQLFMTNAFGNNASSVATVAIEPTLGFYDGSAWTLNGGATIDASSVLTLTDGGASEARTAFFNAPVTLDAFSASFTYQNVNAGGSDGAAFILQNAPVGPFALGAGGGGLGYAGITPSAALELNIYKSEGIAVRTGGATGIYRGTSPVNVANGNPIGVTVQYASGNMVVTLTDAAGGVSVTNIYQVDLASAVGSHTAYVGFSGGDGGLTSMQQISAFTFAPIPAGPPQFLAEVHPAPLIQPAGLAFTLSAPVAGTAPLYFQWKFNGINLTNNSRISGANSNALTTAYALSSDAGNYELVVTNSYGSITSQVAAVTVTNAIGFYDGSAWALNGGPTIDANSVLTVTDGGANEARSAFLASPVPINAFLASFTYKDVTGGGANGLAFILQNSPVGASALGGVGGGLGYWDNSPNQISPSAALEFNIYTGVPGGRGIALATNGLTADHGGAPYASTAPVDLASGHPIDVTLRYVGGALSLTLTDAVASVSFSTNFSLNLPAIVGASTAYVGFSGATGGAVSQQEVSNFGFIAIPRLSIQMTSTNSLLLSWPVAESRFVLQRNSDLGSASWTTVGNPVGVINGQNQVIVSSPAGKQFYRLALP